MTFHLYMTLPTDARAAVTSPGEIVLLRRQTSGLLALESEMKRLRVRD